MVHESFFFFRPKNEFSWNSLLLSTFDPSFYYSSLLPWKLTTWPDHKRWLELSVVKANICIPKSLQCSQRNEFCHWLQWEVWGLTGQADVSSAGNIFQLASAAASIFFLWWLLKLIFLFSMKLNRWDLCSVLSLEVSFPFFSE